DRAEIDPTRVQDQANPAARLTLGKSLSPRLSTTYSTLIGANEGDIYSLRYDLTRQLTLSGSHEQSGALAGDLRYGFKRHLGPGGPAVLDGVGGHRIAVIEFHGGVSADEDKLRKRLGLRRGDSLRNAVLLDGIDEIRNWYVRRGRPEVRIEHAVEPIEAGRVTIDVHIDEGPEVMLSFPGTSSGDALRKAVLTFWSESVFPDVRVADSAEVVREALAARGYVHASVEPDLGQSSEERVSVAFRIDQGPRVHVDEIVIDGAQAIDEGQVRSQMITLERSLFERGWLKPAQLGEDVDAILALYRSRGYLDTRVGQRVEYPREKNRARVVIAIDEGPAYHVARIVLSGNAAFEEELLRSLVNISAGDRFDDLALREAEAAWRSFYDTRGYPNARVRTRAEIDAENKSVDIGIEIVEGQHLIVDEVGIEHEGLTKQAVIRREIDLEAGDPLSEQAVARSRQALYGTGVFRSVGVSREPTGAEGGRRVAFELTEAPNLRGSVGVGADSDEGWRVSAELGHANLGGRRIYGGLAVRWSDKELRGQLLARKPRLWGSRWDGLTSTFWEDLERDAFRVRRTGFNLQTSRSHDVYNVLLSYQLEDADVTEGGVIILDGDVIGGDLSDIAGIERTSNLRLGSLRAGVARDTRDALGWPTRGSFTHAGVRLFHQALASEADFVRASLQWSRYQQLGRRLIWSSGLYFGAAETLGDTRFVPISERFFAGGESSIRGFDLDSITAVGFPGDLLADFGVTVSEPLGGAATFQLNQELIFPLWKDLYGVAFLDAGNVYWQIGDIDLTDLRAGAGVGLRFRTPAGPLRLEYGWKLDRNPNESAGELHFSLGLVF
ncbi:MAG: outer membrane protein assembly factor BamA, partial [Acidobacteriota bacterium]